MVTNTLPETEETVLRASATTPPQELASTIAHACYAGKPPVIRAIGASAINQAMKSLIIASQYVASRGLSIVFRPGFQTVEVVDDGEVRQLSAIVVRVILSD